MKCGNLAANRLGAKGKEAAEVAGDHAGTWHHFPTYTDESESKCLVLEKSSGLGFPHPSGWAGKSHKRLVGKLIISQHIKKSSSLPS